MYGVVCAERGLFMCDKQQKRGDYLKDKAMLEFDIEVKLSVSNEDGYVSASFSDIGELVNWCIRHVQVASITRSNIALYGVQKNIKDDFK